MWPSGGLLWLSPPGADSPNTEHTAPPLPSYFYKSPLPWHALLRKIVNLLIVENYLILLCQNICVVSYTHDGIRRVWFLAHRPNKGCGHSTLVCFSAESCHESMYSPSSHHPHSWHNTLYHHITPTRDKTQSLHLTSEMTSAKACILSSPIYL